MLEASRDNLDLVRLAIFNLCIVECRVHCIISKLAL